MVCDGAFHARDRGLPAFTLQLDAQAKANKVSINSVTVCSVTRVDTPAAPGAIDGRPFAALRSMYVTDFNNDVARIAVREMGSKGWREDAIMAFKRATASEVWAGRIVPSRHNTSSPDMMFSAFSDSGGTPAPPKK